jgi:hypothetical protein
MKAGAFRIHEPEDLPEALPFFSARIGEALCPRALPTSLFHSELRGFFMSGGVMTEQRGQGLRSPMERLNRYLEKLAGGEFYGKVTVSFQNGKVQDIKVEQTKKLDEL